MSKKTRHVMHTCEAPQLLENFEAILLRVQSARLKLEAPTVLMHCIRRNEHKRWLLPSVV